MTTTMAVMRSDDKLVRAAASGDGAAWDTLVDKYGQLVFANARAAGADNLLAQDISQLVWMRLLTRIDTIRDPSKVRGWLAVVARNATRSELRRRKPQIDIDSLFHLEDPNAPLPERETTRAEDRVEVRTALAKISDRCRALLTLLFNTDMSYQEIADMVEMPVGSIGPTRQRCLAALAQHLEGGDDGE